VRIRARIQDSQPACCQVIHNFFRGGASRGSLLSLIGGRERGLQYRVLSPYEPRPQDFSAHRIRDIYCCQSYVKPVMPSERRECPINSVVPGNCYCTVRTALTDPKFSGKFHLATSPMTRSGDTRRPRC